MLPGPPKLRGGKGGALRSVRPVRHCPNSERRPSGSSKRRSAIRLPVSICALTFSLPSPSQSATVFPVSEPARGGGQPARTHRVGPQ